MKNLLYILICYAFLMFACKKPTKPNSTIALEDGPDITAPLITLKGETNYTLVLEGFFVEYGASAMDNKDGDISKLISQTGSVNTSLAGTYTIGYNVKDTEGNRAFEKIRTIVVRNDIDNLNLEGNYSCLTTCNQNTASITTSTVSLTSSKTKNKCIAITPLFNGYDIEVNLPNLYFSMSQGHATGLFSGDGKSFTITTRYGDINNPTITCVGVYKKND